MLVFGPDGLLYIANGDMGDSTNSPKPDTKYGKILRVDVGTAAPATPNLNPTVVQLGLRNPWRFSFDRANGDMWIGDVGERLREEIDYAPAGMTGLNFGWPTMEGSMCANTGCSMTGLTLPVYDYGRDQGQTVVGGYVYRGSNIPCFRGRYIFADWNQNGLWSFVLSGGQATNFLDHTALVPMRTLSSFGEDLAGELYVTFLTPGQVYRIDPR
jgi:glucose/arabinose dehydrogenase